MNYTWRELDERQKVAADIAARFPPGSLCIIANATGKAKATVYRVVKHWAPGEKDEGHDWGRIRHAARQRRTNVVWKTQVEPVLNLDFSGDTKRKSGKTSYNTVLLCEVDLIALCSARAALDAVIQAHVKQMGDQDV